MESTLSIHNGYFHTSVAGVGAMPSSDYRSKMVAFVNIFKRGLHFFVCLRVAVFMSMPWHFEVDTAYYTVNG